MICDAFSKLHYAWSLIHDAWYSMHDTWCMMNEAWWNIHDAPKFNSQACILPSSSQYVGFMHDALYINQDVWCLMHLAKSMIHLAWYMIYDASFITHVGPKCHSQDWRLPGMSPKWKSQLHNFEEFWRNRQNRYPQGAFL